MMAGSSASLLCGCCGLLVPTWEALHAHFRSTQHGSFYVPSDGCLNMVCSASSCNRKFSSLKLAEQHMDHSGPGHMLKEEMASEMVTMNIKKDLVAELESKGCVTLSALRLQHSAEGHNTPTTNEGQHNPLQSSPGTVHMGSNSPDGSPVANTQDIALTPEVQGGTHDTCSVTPGSEEFENAAKEISDQVKKMYGRRRLANLKLARPRTIEQVRKSYFYAEDEKPDVVIQRINAVLEPCDPENGMFTFLLPATDKEDSYVFDEELGQICLTRQRQQTACSTDHYRRDRRLKAKRIGEFLLIIKVMVQAQELARLRIMYYKYPDIHGSAEQADRTIEAIAALIECSRESFGIRTSPKGCISGAISLYIDEEQIVDCRMGGLSACMVPTQIDKINGVRVHEKIDFLVVLEKDTVFDQLSYVRFPEKFNCVMVTGKGQSDIATRALIRKLKEHLDVPVYCFVDGNPSGLGIYLTYRFGSDSHGYDNLQLTVPDMTLLGLFPSDVEVKRRKPMGSSDKKKLEKMLQKAYIINDEYLRKKLLAMLRDNKIADIETIMTKENISDYVSRQINSIRIGS